jgi:Holliday junction resolvase
MLVAELKELGLEAERVPLSGSCGGSFSGDLIVKSGDLTLRVEVKSRKGGAGFAQLEKWLGANDLLVLKRDRQAPMALIPWNVFVMLLTGTGSFINASPGPLNAVEADLKERANG